MWLLPRLMWGSPPVPDVRRQQRRCGLDLPLSLGGYGCDFDDTGGNHRGRVVAAGEGPEMSVAREAVGVTLGALPNYCWLAHAGSQMGLPGMVAPLSSSSMRRCACSSA